MAEKGLISEGKKEELLMDAYRADIVYNFDEEETNLNDWWLIFWYGLFICIFVD